MMPPRIDASPEEIARVVLNVKPPKKWKYLDTYAETRRERTPEE